MEVRVPDLSIKYALYGNVCASAVTYTPRALSLTHTHTHTSLVPRLSPHSAVFGESLGTRLHTHTHTIH